MWRNYGRYRTGRDNVSQIDRFRRYPLPVVGQRALYRYPVSYTHLDVYKRQVCGCVFGLVKSGTFPSRKSSTKNAMFPASSNIPVRQLQLGCIGAMFSPIFASLKGNVFPLRLLQSSQFSLYVTALILSTIYSSSSYRYLLSSSGNF